MSESIKETIENGLCIDKADFALEQFIQVKMLESLMKEETDPDLKEVYKGLIQEETEEFKKAKHLSTGNNQRLGLAKALMHHPKLLILDEPINGLDPAGIVEIREFLKDLATDHNSTIFLSSHILSEISRLTTRIGIIHEGKLVKEINAHELTIRSLKS